MYVPLCLAGLRLTFCDPFSTIARALANDPEILLLDEPTGDLDTRNTVDVMDLLLKINHERKTTFLMVTHNPDIECYADRLIYLADGKIQRQAVNKQQNPLIYDDYIAYLNYIQKNTTSGH